MASSGRLRGIDRHATEVGMEKLGNFFAGRAIAERIFDGSDAACPFRIVEGGIH